MLILISITFLQVLIIKSNDISLFVIFNLTFYQESNVLLFFILILGYPNQYLKLKINIIIIVILITYTKYCTQNFELNTINTDT